MAATRRRCLTRLSRVCKKVVVEGRAGPRSLSDFGESLRDISFPLFEKPRPINLGNCYNFSEIRSANSIERCDIFIFFPREWNFRQYHRRFYSLVVFQASSDVFFARKRDNGLLFHLKIHSLAGFCI